MNQKRGGAPYLSGHGDHGYRVSHYDLTVDYRPQPARLSGRARITAAVAAVAPRPLAEVRLDFGRLRVDRVQLGHLRHARVARCGVHLGDLGVTRERQRERVLATAGADDEDLHVGVPGPVRAERAASRGVRRTTVCSRLGPTPTAQNGAPDISSSART